MTCPDQVQTVTESTDRLAKPDVVSWPIYPFEDQMRVREIQLRFDQERTAA